MKLPDLRDFDLTEKKVLLRTDLDVPLVQKTARPASQSEAGEDGRQKTVIADETRIEESLPTINHLLSKNARVVILAHLGRPEGKQIPELSLEPVAEVLSLLLRRNREKKEDGWMIGEEIFLKENLRFDKGEEENDSEFAKKLALMGDFYVNDAFAASHREHASIVGLPKLLPHAAGLDLLEEVKTLSSVRKSPKRPVVVILGGVKKSKLNSVNGLLSWVDRILIGGKLADYPETTVLKDSRRELAILTKSGEDITIESAEKFIQEIREAGTIIWSGPLGKVEEPKFEKGTRIFAEAMAESKAFRIVGGGDTEAALTRFGLVEKIDYVSSGGGAMLEYLANGDLPGLKALRN